MNLIIRWIYFNLFVRFIVMVILGLNVRNRQLIPNKGPAIIVANHNSHLDTMVLMTLLPRNLLNRVQPVAAMDYFLRNPLLAWFAQKVIGILPLKRQRADKNEDPFKDIDAALEMGNILIFFPEGSRGEPEQLARFKKGIARLAERHPKVPVTPVYLHGLGKALPKGQALFVPFFCDVFVGEQLSWQPDRHTYMQNLEQKMLEMQQQAQQESATWE